MCSITLKICRRGAARRVGDVHARHRALTVSTEFCIGVTGESRLPVTRNYR